MKNLILTLPFLFFCHILVGQEIDSLTVYYSAQNIVIRIDNSEVISLAGKSNPYTFPIDAGSHKVEAWAKGYEIEEYDVKIILGKRHYLNIGMKTLKQEFKDYLKDTGKYNNTKFKDAGVVSLPTVFTVLAVGSFLQVNNENSKLFVNLADAKKNYSRAINDTELFNAERRHSDALQDIKNRRRFAYISTGLTLGTSTLAYLYFKKKKSKTKIDRPKYEETNPFVLVNYKQEKTTNFSISSTGLVYSF